MIGGILLAAFERLSAALGAREDTNYWLPERAKTVINDLRVRSVVAPNCRRPEHGDVRYSPITENYRPMVDLSLSILTHRPRWRPREANQAFGVLLDMAEIWEFTSLSFCRSVFRDCR